MPGVTLGYLRYILGFDTLSFRKGATEAEVRLQRMERTFKNSFGAINAGFSGFAAAFSVGILTAGIKKALDYAGSLGEISQQLGVTTRDLQVLRYAAGQVGVSQEQLEIGLQKLTVTLGQVAAGAKAPAAALKAIGVTTDELKGKDTGEAFRIIADGLAKIPDRAQRAAVEVALFGKSGAKLDTLLAGGRKVIDELAAAAEKLGIVLSEEQIQRADETADKLEAVKTVLAANIAGVVADNASSIVSLASSLGQLTGEIVKFLSSNPAAALGIIGALAGFRVAGLPGAGLAGAAALIFGLEKFGPGEPAPDQGFLKKRFIQEADILKKMRASGQPFGDQQAKVRRLRDRYVQAGGSIPGYNPFALAAGTDISPFLASGGGGKPKKDNSAAEAERKRREQVRDAFQFAQDERRGQLDILRAQQELTVNTEDRAKLALEMLDLGHKGALAEIQYQVDMGDIDGAQAKILISQEDKLDALQRDAIAADKLAQKTENEDRMAETRFGIRRAELQAMLNLAQTTDERRRLSLQLLDLEYQEKKQALERIVANQQLTDAVRDRARAELDALPRQQALDKQGVLLSTQGPLEQAKTQFGDITEEMENLKVQGIMGVADAIATLPQGFEAFKQAAVSAIQQVIAEFIRLQTMKFLFNLIGTAAGGAGGGAGGGGFSLGSSPLPGPMSFGGGFALTGRAVGGPVQANRAYLIGEKGPEIASFGRSGTIIPNHKLASLFGGGGGGDLNVKVQLPHGMRPHEGRPTGLAIGRGVQERLAYGARGRRFA